MPGPTAPTTCQRSSAAWSRCHAVPDAAGRSRVTHSAQVASQQRLPTSDPPAMVDANRHSRFQPCADTAAGAGTRKRSTRPGSTEASSGNSLAPWTRARQGAHVVTRLGCRHMRMAMRQQMQRRECCTSQRQHDSNCWLGCRSRPSSACAWPTTRPPATQTWGPMARRRMGLLSQQRRHWLEQAAVVAAGGTAGCQPMPAASAAPRHCERVLISGARCSIGGTPAGRRSAPEPTIAGRKTLAPDVPD